VLALAEPVVTPTSGADKYDIITIAAVADDAEMVATAVKAGGKATNITSIYDGTALIAAAHEGNWHRRADQGGRAAGPRQRGGR
jgi:hypothetical protein